MAYTYGHVRYDSLTPEFADCINAYDADPPPTEYPAGCGLQEVGTKVVYRVPAGMPLAWIGNWCDLEQSLTCDCCTRSHLHYQEMAPQEMLLHPLARIGPYADGVPPELDEIRVCDAMGATGDEWTCQLPTENRCVHADRPFDILVKFLDRTAGASPAGVAEELGFESLQFRVCGGRPRSCTVEEGISFRQLDWGNVWYHSDAVTALFSDRKPHASEADYCTDDTFWLVPTQLQGSKADKDADLDLPNASASDGYYVATTTVTDFGGNSTAAHVALCRDTARTGVTQLLVRDCPEDVGQEPSGCPGSESSPDLKASWTPSRWPAPFDRPRVELQVCAGNVGTSVLPPSQDIRVDVQLRNRIRQRLGLDVDASETGRSFLIPVFAWRRDVPAAPFLTWSFWFPGERLCTTLDLGPPPPSSRPLIGWWIETHVAACAQTIPLVPGDCGAPARLEGSTLEDNNAAQVPLVSIATGD